MLLNSLTVTLIATPFSIHRTINMQICPASKQPNQLRLPDPLGQL